MRDVNSPDERHQEDLVHRQGVAYQASMHELVEGEPHAESVVDDYCIATTFEPAEGMYVPGDDGSLRWRTPTDGQNQHFEVIVRDREDGRFIPGLDVRLRLLDGGGAKVAETKVPFIWHPFVFHYGIDGKIPGEGDYRAEIVIAPPSWNRHDEVRGRRYEREATVTLGPLHLTPGVRPRGPE